MAALQRLASCVGLGLGGPRIAAAAASSSSALWLRAYSGEAAGGSDTPAESEGAPAAEAAEAAPPAEAEASGPPVVTGAQCLMEKPSGRVPHACMCTRSPPCHGEVRLPATPPAPPAADDNGEVVPQDLFTKRQLLRMGAIDPDRTKHFLPRLSRAELGSYADDYVAEEFDVEVRPVVGTAGMVVVVARRRCGCLSACCWLALLWRSCMACSFL